MDNLRVCGVVVTNDRDIVPLYACDRHNNYKELFYNNDPFGIVSVFGFENIAIGDIGDDCSTGSKMDIFAKAIKTRARGAAYGIIDTGTNLLIVRDLESFQCDIQEYKGTGTSVQYKGYIDVAEADDELPEYAEMCEILGII